MTSASLETKWIVALAIAAMPGFAWAQPQAAPAPGAPGAAGGEHQNDALEDVDLLRLLAVEVSTATKTLETLDDAPALVTAITAEEIRRWGYKSVGEVLQHVVGFYLIDDHILPNASVQGVTGGLGAESGGIKVMIDGRSVAFRTTSGNWLGTELIPLSAIKQIEVIRGPASALYGADAFLGVVNIITLSGEDIPYVDGTLQAGVTRSHPSGRLDVLGGMSTGYFDMMLMAAAELDDRSGLEMPRESPAPRVPGYNAGRRDAQNLERRSAVLGSRIAFRDPAHGHHLVLSAFWSGFQRGGDFAQWAQLTGNADTAGGPAGVPASGTVIALHQRRVSVDGLLQLNPELALAVQGMYFHGGVLPGDRVDVPAGWYYIDRHMAYRGVDANVELRWVPSSRFNLILNLESIYDNEDLPTFRRIGKSTGQIFGSPRRDERTFESVDIGSLLSANLKVLDPWLKLTGGVRYDHHNKYGSQLTGRFGATSRLGKTVVAKLLYGSAFKAPSPYLLYAEPLVPGDVIGNEDLEPQFIHTVDAEVTWRPAAWLSASTGVSYSRLNDKAEFVPRGINETAENLASQTSVIWATRADVRRGDDLGGYGSFETVYSTRDSGQVGYQADLVGPEMVAYPRWIARAGAYVKLPSPRSVPLELSTQGIVVGPRRAADSSILEHGGSFDLPPYFWWNASLVARNLWVIPGHETTVALRAKNLLGATGPDPGFSGFEYPLAPREIFLELRHRY
ncbi:outer membrane protein [Sorangium cellulosum]|uniref:Outer membrane protein n=1 Tax=Sorangium cellulosum TaxID=56 RepID=A0A4P2PW55_SORCE|nr:TonB-dependent receptor [Sorangium cellulosum]AUX20716.1 outer membrane protein [Sorangium cellulosum]